MSFEILKNHLDKAFPEIWNQVKPNKVTSVLLIQIKRGNVHPNNRDPDMDGDKTQIEITAPVNDSISNPTTVLFNSDGVPSDELHDWPVNAWESARRTWIPTSVQVSGIGQPHRKGSLRIKLGGMNPDTWSSIVWANMGHYQLNPFGFVLFVREGMTKNPYSFSLPNHGNLQDLLKSHGSTPQMYKNGPMAGTPKSIAAVINGTWDSETLHESLEAQYLYAATHVSRIGPRVGWIKIGKTKRSPRIRLKEYDNAFERYDMNYIRMTSDCDEAEKDLIRRLKDIGMERKSVEDGRGKKTEWFKTDSITTIKNCIDEVVKIYHHPEDVKLEPLIRANPGESWLELDLKPPTKNKPIIAFLKKLKFWKRV